MVDFVVILFIVLSIVTLVGHGIWALLAAIFRALASASREGGAARQRRCPYCNYPNPAYLDHCAWCSEPLPGPKDSHDLGNLAALRRQLTRLCERGVIGPGDIESLSKRLEVYENRLRQQPPVSQPAQAGPPPVQAAPQPAAPPRQDRPPVLPTATSPVPLAAAIVKPTPEPGQPKAQPQPAAAVRPEPKPPAPPPPPRKSWMELVAEFFEERNVRLAEVILVLVGGLLIVGGSVAVVISFWQQMESYLKFSVFVGISSAVFGLGLIGYHRWKLEISGRGLLVIATLLVPLNFLAMASLSKEDWTLLTLATELVSLAIFVYLVGLASQVLVPGRVWHQVLAVVGNSAAVLLVARLTGEGARGWPISAVGALPVGILAVALGGYLFPMRKRETLEPRHADGIFLLAGTAGFALAIALGLLIAKGARSDGLAITLQHVAPLVTLAAIPILTAGLIVKQRIGGASIGAYTTAGTALAMAAVAVMIGSLALAWPRPLGVMAVGVFDAAALVYAALRHRLPVAHAGAIACAAVVYLVGFHLAAGHLDWDTDQGRRMVQLALGAQSGTALVGLFGLLAVMGEWLARRGLRSHAVQYVGGSAVIALASLLLVTAHHQFTGGASAFDAMLVYGIYGTCSLAMAARWQRQWFSYLGLALVAGATLWALRWRIEEVTPLWGAVLAAEALAMGLLGVILNRLRAWHCLPARRLRSLEMPLGVDGGVRASSDTQPTDRTRWIEVYRLPLLHAAEALSAVALGLALWTFDCSHTPAPVVTAACLAALYFLTAWGCRSRGRTWIASALVLLGLTHTLVWNYGDWVERPWVVAFLAHATLSALASTILTFLTRPHADAEPIADLRRVFIEPLAATSLISSTIALPLMLAAGGIDALLLAEYLFWLAAIWLVIAWTEGRPGWFTAAQAVLTVATVTATTAWLERHPWDAVAASKIPIDLRDPRTLHAYGIGLAVLSLVWVVVRILLRKNTEARRLLDPGWPAVDRVVGHTVVAAQFLLAARYLAAACGRELIDWIDPMGTWQRVAFGPAAWLLVGVSAVMLLAALWHRWRDAEVFSGLMAAATLAYLAAGQFVADRTAATAASWLLAFAFLLLGAIIWLRRRLLAACLRLGARVEWGRHSLGGCQALILSVTAAPALILTVLGSLERINGILPLTPAAESLFAGLDPNVAYAVPQLLLMVGLVGFALREKSAAYAFCAGLVAQMGVVLGYLVSLAIRGQSLGMAVMATSVQLATITAAIWAIVWLAARRWVHLWREGSEGDASGTLMDVQLGMGVVGNAVLLVPALAAIALLPSAWHAWAVQAGSPWGWIALGLTVIAVVCREAQLGRRWAPDALGLAGMAAIGLSSCTVLWLRPEAAEWGYRTLMLGWAIYCVLVVAATWRLTRTKGSGVFFHAGGKIDPSVKAADAGMEKDSRPLGALDVLINAASRWTAVSGILATLLGLKAAFFHLPWEELLWASAAIALAAAACATMAVWRRAEGWAFTAALGVNLAASLVVWYCEGHARGQLTLEDWWVHLLQANAIASAAAAMVWLAARRRLYAAETLTVRTSPLLAAQTSLGAVATAILLVPALAHIVSAPARLPWWIGQLTEPAGWTALVLVALSTAWYLRRFSPRDLIHVVAGLGLGAGILAACLSAKWNCGTPWGDWLAYHVLESSWAAAGVVVLGLGLLGLVEQASRLLGRFASGTSGTLVLREFWNRLLIFPRKLVQAWVTWIGAAVVGLALFHAKADPAAPWWSVSAILVVSLSAGILAMGLRLPVYVALSGLLINVAGTVMWLAWGPWNPYALVEFNVVCLAIASGIWSIVGLAYRPGVPPLEVGGRPEAVAHAAAKLAVMLIAALATVLVIQDIQIMAHPLADRLAWIALAATADALAICLWDRSAGFVLPGLYALGLAAVGLSWDARGLTSRGLAWTSVCELAGFALAAALVGLLAPAMRPVWRAIRIPLHRKQPAADWFPAAQAATIGVAAVLAAWISIDLDFDSFVHSALPWPSGRMAGFAASLVLLPASVTMAAAAQDRWRRAWQYAALVLGMMLLSTPGWAVLWPEWGDLGMHRSVVLMVAAVILALVGGFGLERIVPGGSDWIAAGRKCFPVFAVVAVAALAAIMGQEFYHYVPYEGAPMALPAVVIVAVALAGLLVGCLACALAARLDPFGLSDRGRTVYVYAAEAIALVIGVHLRLTVPDLFRLAIVAKYWMLMAMAVSFGGAGLSELFHRRGLPVLSEPLERTAMLLPLAPAAGFWFVPDFLPHQQWLLAGRSPAVWFLAAIFYGFLAATRRGAWATALFTLLSLAAANLGLSVMWYQYDTQFFWAHPQVWLIPIGLSILLAEYFNRQQLTPAQSAAVRYLALSVIYVPSSAEYLQAIGQSVWLPLVLILLSLAGVLAGIVLRIRSFLYLGVTFLALVITTMVRYAAVDLQKTWVLYLCCVFLGILMVAVVMMYEKRRDAILAAVRQFREWQK